MTERNGCAKKHLAMVLLVLVPLLAGSWGLVKVVMAGLETNVRDHENRLRVVESTVIAGKASREAFEKEVRTWMAETKDTLHDINRKLDRRDGIAGTPTPKGTGP